MKTLLFFVLATIAVFPAVAIIILFAYKLYNDFRQGRFEKGGNMVLTRERIGDTLKRATPSESLRIFKSAICDHASVDGVRYYTRFPFGSKLITAHDHHRRAFIGHEIGEMVKKSAMLNGDLSFCTDILLCLSDCFKEKYYTQLFAWNSLSRVAYLHPWETTEAIGIDYIKECLAKDFLTGIGALKFVMNLNQANECRDFVGEMTRYVIEHADLPVVALLTFELSRNASFARSQKKYIMKRLPDDPKFISFLTHMDALHLGFTRDELSEGLRNLGLQPRPYSPKTTEGEIVRFLVTDYLEEIYVTSSYVLHSFNSDDLRQHLTDFLWS